MADRKKKSEPNGESGSVESHDQNFKNLFFDFPTEALRWLLPKAMEIWGPVTGIEFLRQEPKKWKLGHYHLSLDMPILFAFGKNRLLLWLVEFQEDKQKFSIHRLHRYTSDYMEICPEATVIPVVLFTDRKKWRKQAPKKLETRFADRLFLHFEYVFVKLFDFEARDYYHSENPLIRILLPKMNHTADERTEVIRQAYVGLFQLVSPMLFDKYVDFIDIYAEVEETEREDICRDLYERKETAMIAQYIREKGKQEGIQAGIQKGIQEGIRQGLILGKTNLFVSLLEARFGRIPDWATQKIEQADLAAIEKWTIRVITAQTIADVFES